MPGFLDDSRMPRKSRQKIVEKPTPDTHPLASPPPHATPQTSTLTLHNETPPNKRPCLYTTRQCLRETNKPSTPTLNSPTSPTARPITPTFDDYVPSPAHDVVRLAPTLTVPKPSPFSPLYMPLHRPNFTSPQSLHQMRPQLLPPTTLKSIRPDSRPPASPPPRDALRTDAASPEPLEAHDVAETKTKKPRLRNAEARLRHQANRAARRAMKGTDEEPHPGVQGPCLGSKYISPLPRPRQRFSFFGFFGTFPSPQKGGGVGWGAQQRARGNEINTAMTLNRFLTCGIVVF